MNLSKILRKLQTFLSLIFFPVEIDKNIKIKIVRILEFQEYKNFVISRKFSMFFIPLLLIGDLLFLDTFSHLENYELVGAMCIIIYIFIAITMYFKIEILSFKDKNFLYKLLLFISKYILLLYIFIIIYYSTKYKSSFFITLLPIFYYNSAIYYKSIWSRVLLNSIYLSWIFYCLHINFVYELYFEFYLEITASVLICFLMGTIFQNIYTKSIIKTENNFIKLKFEERNRKFYQQTLIEEKNKSLLKSRFKEEYLTKMSHEIRTPLHTIINTLNELDRANMDFKSKKLVKYCNSASSHLYSLISNIIDLSKMQENQLFIEFKQINLVEIFDEIKMISHLFIKQNDNTFTLDFDSSINPKIYGDEKRLKQIIINLLSNSSKFTKNGTISLKVSLLEKTIKFQKIQIDINDTGIGMNEELINNLLNLDKDNYLRLSYGSQGAGIGFGITNELIKMMGGKIDIKSTPYKGSCISVIFKFDNIIHETSKVIDKPKEYRLSLSFENLKVLLVEDNDINRLLFRYLLEKNKVIVDEAVNGIEALEYIKNNQYDIILMDIMLPAMNGNEVVLTMRSELNTTPVIAITANSLRDDINNYLNNGFNDFLIKPFYEDDLLKKINSVLNITK